MIGGEVISTEDLKRKVQDLNKALGERTFRGEAPIRFKQEPTQDLKDLKMFSMDVSALYPSIKSEMAAKAVEENVKLSKLE